MAASGDPCVSFAVAKAHLRVTSDDEDELIEEYLDIAQHAVMDRLERATTDSLVLAMYAEWDEDTTPGAIKAAVLTQCAELYRFRGDDETELKADAEGRLSQRVERYLGPWLERPLA